MKNLEKAEDMITKELKQVWIASDGKQFAKKQDAIIYQAELIWYSPELGDK